MHDELTNGHVDSKEGEVEGGKTKGKDSSVGGTNGMANKENGGVITKDGAVKSGERYSAEESEFVNSPPGGGGRKGEG